MELNTSTNQDLVWVSTTHRGWECWHVYTPLICKMVKNCLSSGARSGWRHKITETAQQVILKKKKKNLTLKLKLTKMTYAVVKHMQRICLKSVTHKICVIHPLIIMWRLKTTHGSENRKVKPWIMTMNIINVQQPKIVQSYNSAQRVLYAFTHQHWKTKKEIKVKTGGRQEK